jgi:hypothetical protein
MEEYFKDQGCTLLEKDGSTVRYIAKCGHEHVTRLDVFKHGCARFCKICTIKRIPKRDYHKQEGDSFIYISKILDESGVFEVKRTNEGCLADFIMRPRSVTADEWVQVQIKTTCKAIHGVYTFSIHRKYPNCVIVCHCISENRFWVFRDYEVPEKSIGIRSGGKYATYEVVQSNMVEKMREIYDTITHVKSENTMIPSSPSQRIEYQYRLKRERFFPDVRFEYPDYEHRRYDFIVNGKKYQEKVATWKENRYVFKSVYNPGDNDFYVIHIPDSDYFYCIPEQQLIEHQNTSGCITLNTTKHKMWYAPYRHTYGRRDFSF